MRAKFSSSGIINSVNLKTGVDFTPVFDIIYAVHSRKQYFKTGRTEVFMKKAAVIGYGGMGQWHVAYMEGLSYAGMKMSKSDVINCAGIYDIDPKKQ